MDNKIKTRFYFFKFQSPHHKTVERWARLQAEWQLHIPEGAVHTGAVHTGAEPAHHLQGRLWSAVQDTLAVVQGMDQPSWQHMVLVAVLDKLLVAVLDKLLVAVLDKLLVAVLDKLLVAVLDKLLVAVLDKLLVVVGGRRP